MIRRIAALSFAALFVAGASNASAQSCQSNAGNIVLNCSFELTNPIPGADYPFANVSDWTPLSGPQGGTFERWTNGFDGFYAQDGNSHIELQVNGPTIIQQVLGTTAGSNYSLSFWAAHRPRDIGGYSQLDVYLNGSFFMSTGHIADPYQWHNFGMDFVATGNETLEFRAMGNQLSYGDFLDNVTVEGTIGTAVVPEPSTMVLTGAGFAMVGFMARRRRQV